MSMDRPHTPPPLWTSLVQYYRSCLNREQELSVRVPADPRSYVLLREIDEHLITRKAITTILSEPQHTQPVLAYLNRRARGISGTFIYGYPLVRQGDGLVPLCYTEVRLEPGSAPQTVLLMRGNAELLVNRHLLRQGAGLTDAETDGLLRALRSPKSKGPAEVLDQYLLEVEVLYDAVLFASEAAPTVRGPGRELHLMEQLRKERLPDTIRHFIGEQGVPATKPAGESLTIVEADPSQAEALARLRSPFLVVTGPAGSGKSQTAINLIAGAVALGQRVLYITRDDRAIEAAFTALTGEGTFPGVLRIGSREVRAAAMAYARQVIESVRTFTYQADDPAELARQSRQLGEELARLDAEAEDLARLDRLLAELATLTQQVEGSLANHPPRSWILTLANQITPANAGQFQPEQLVAIRHLLARALSWEPESGSLGGRLRDRMRAGQIRSGLKQIGLPEFCHPDGDLPAQIAGLVRLEQSFPLLLARGRQIHAQAQRERHRSPEAFAAALTETGRTKTAVDRRRLHAAWLAVADRVRPRCDELASLIDQEEKMLTAEAPKHAARRARFPELMEAFPVVLSPTFGVAGAIPNEPELFDLLIVDDASPVEIPAFLPVLYRAKRLCILGDPHGPKPANSLGVEEDSRLLGLVQGRNLAAFGYTEVSVLDRAMQVVGPDQIIRLGRQYRTQPALCEWMSEQFYDGQVRPGIARPTEAALILEDVPDGATIYPAGEAISQAQNPMEARRVLQLATQQIGRGETDLAILTPFRGQALLLQMLLSRLSEADPDPMRAAALRQVAVLTPDALAFRRFRSVLLSPVAARGATPETLRWLETRRNDFSQMLSAASDRVVIAGHRATLEAAGSTLASLVAHADQLAAQPGPSGAAAPGLQPHRFGLLQAERRLLQEWLTLPDGLDSLSEGERELHTRLTELLKGLPALLAPRLSLATALEPAVLAALPPADREAAAGAHPLLTLVHTRTLRPLAAIELEDGGSGPVAEAICRQANLPLVRVRPGQWQVLRSVISLVPQN